jgi:hypothetical protein
MIPALLVALLVSSGSTPDASPVVFDARWLGDLAHDPARAADDDRVLCRIRALLPMRELDPFRAVLRSPRPPSEQGARTRDGFVVFRYHLHGSPNEGRLELHPDGRVRAHWSSTEREWARPARGDIVDWGALTATCEEESRVEARRRSERAAGRRCDQSAVKGYAVVVARTRSMLELHDLGEECGELTPACFSARAKRVDEGDLVMVAPAAAAGFRCVGLPGANSEWQFGYLNDSAISRELNTRVGGRTSMPVGDWRQDTPDPYAAFLTVTSVGESLVEISGEAANGEHSGVIPETRWRVQGRSVVPVSGAERESCSGRISFKFFNNAIIVEAPGGCDEWGWGMGVTFAGVYWQAPMRTQAG